MLAIVAIPSVAMLVVGACLSGYLVDQGLRARTFADNVRAALGPTARFVAAAQEERRLTIRRLSQPGQSRSALDDQRQQVDAALAEMTATDGRLAQDAPPDLRASLTAFGQAAAQVPEMRQRVDGGLATAQDTYAFFDDLLALCGANIQGIARSATDATVGFEQMIAYDLFKSAEAMSRAHAMAERAVQSGLSPEQFHELAHQLGMYHEQVQTLAPRMTRQERDTYAALQTTTAWKTLVADDNYLMYHGPTTTGTGPAAVPFAVPDWESAAQQVSQALMGLYLSHSGYAADLGAASAQRTLLTSWVAGVAILLLVFAVLAVALRMSGRLIRRLSRLREETLELADERLPALLSRLRAGAVVDVAAEVPWLDHGDDEIGQVADAFNEAQRTAIAATVREAETRQGVRAVFLNIAHRSQVIVHRQLKVLDEAERSLDDPDQLQLLFQLDHLATRGRRNAENLIILGGEHAGRQWRNPVPLREVVRSAIAETEDYTRVTTVRLPDVPMVGAVVADLIHLLAELVDNATSFSPPQAQVEVRGNVVGRGVVVEIEDQGLGIEPEELEAFNAMLRDPPDFDVMALSAESRIGLFVVARLAARHGIKVSLRESVYDGVRATVLLPSALIAEPEPDRATPAEPEPPTHGRGPAMPPGDGPTALPTRTPSPPRPVGSGNGAGHVAITGAGIGSGNGSGNGSLNGSGGDPGGGPGNDSGGTGRAPLPRRERQASLAPQLLADEPGGPAEQPADGAPRRTPERSRNTMTAFQHGTRRARAGDESEPAPGNPRPGEGG
ncbi:histidine kinase [Gandjariella thermophila]|uniref:histidine kinase n=1 Tax=Gandjariella thermophila TaxID=1931992 RepID=A0A4D4J3A5_9PSEU|nr:histidine kinase [Gandjariella thermophila]